MERFNLSKLWLYLYNLPQFKREIKKEHLKSTFKGISRIVSLREYYEYLKVGKEVITPFGTGKIVCLNRENDTAIVYLFRKYEKCIPINLLETVLVYNPLIDLDLELTPVHLIYIIEHIQEIEYTISSKYKARLTESYITQNEWIKILNTRRLGNILIKELKKKNFKFITNE